MIHRHLTYIFTFILIFMGINSFTALCGAEIPDVAQSPEALETISAEEISRLFHEANSMFSDANKLTLTDPAKATSFYKKSILRFERMIKEGGIENGKLYYNIGNIYFRIKDIGRAILNYRRAEQYIGNDINLQKNLEFARNTRKDQIAEKQETKVLKTLFFWHYDLSAKTRLILFTLSFGLLWLFATARLFIKKPFFKWAISISAALSILFTGSLAIEYITLQKTIPGVVISQEVIARKGNSASYKKSFKEPLHTGTEFTLLEHRGNWLQVELPDARTCWVPAMDVELVR